MTAQQLRLMPGTPFQKKVWAEIIKIKAGKTVTYGDLAVKIGHPRSARPVAQACNANPCPPDIPCHRVVGKKDIGGYRFGVAKKRALLKVEGAIK